MKEIYLAGGCFWGIQKYFDMISGVESTIVGYANGITKNPTYEEVCTQKTGFTETIKIFYNEEKLYLSSLLDAYFDIIDPTILNRQGNDIGTNYRTGIYYTNKNDLRIIKETIRLQQSKYDKPILVEAKQLENFYEAEEYHQKYLEKNPQGYCHIPQVKFDTIQSKEMSEYESGE